MSALPSHRVNASGPLLPVLSTVFGIAVFSFMDAAMKASALVVGVMTALLLRNLCATALTIPLWLAAGRPLPTRDALKVHVQRSCLTAGMAAMFFYGLVRIPMAEGIALSFIAPIVALYMASVMLGEKVRRSAILASAVGLVGVAVIAAGRLEGRSYSPEALKGTVAVLISAILYAGNLVLQRKQALLAGAVEVALAQNTGVSVICLAFAPFYFTMPDTHILMVTFAGGLFATMALLLLSWGYARAEAQVLLPVEYTAFGWAALLGWLLFGERVDAYTLVGTALIVVGCWITTRTATRNSA